MREAKAWGLTRASIAAAAVGLLTPLARADAPTDIVPRGSIVYDLLGSLAVAGRLTGYTVADFARGDRLYTRREVAIILARNRTVLLREPRDSPYATAERALAVEFAEELRQLRPEVELPGVPEARSGLLTGQFKLRALSSPAAGSGIARLSATLPVGRDGYAAIQGSNVREEWQVNGQNGYPTIETAYVRVNGRALDVTVGRLPLRVGPGYSGALLVSDESPSIPQVRVEKGFRLPGTVGRRVGRLYFTQIYGEFHEENDPTAPPNAQGTRRHFGLRRFETKSGGAWNFSATEAFKSTRLPDPVFAGILPFYVYQNDWTESSRYRPFKFLVTGGQPNTNWFNYALDLQTSYRADGRGTTFYADLLLDDLKGLFGLGLGDDTPRRSGFQLGAFVPDLFRTGRYALRLEYTSIDRTAYTNISQPVAWFQDDVPLGHAAGSNARVLFGRLDVRLSDKLRVAAEGQSRRRRSTVTGVSEPNASRLGLFATYALRRDLFLGGRVERQRNEPIGLPATTRTRVEGSIGLGF